MIRTLLAACSLLTLVSAPALAQTKPVGRITHLPASTLLRLCQAAPTVKVCDAYVSGIADGITLSESAAGPDSAGRRICIPAASGTQLRGVAVAYLSKHGDRLSADVGPVVYDALAEAFPCGGASQGAAKP